MKTFEQYLIEVGIRSKEFTYSFQTLIDNVDYFKKCWKNNLSGYKALLFLNDYLKGEYIFN